METKFKNMDWVVVTSGKYKNVKGLVMEPFIGNSDVLYSVSISLSPVLASSNFINEIFREADLLPYEEVINGTQVLNYYNPDGNFEGDTLNICNTNCSEVLSKDTMKSIAKDIFKDKINRYIDDALNNRSIYGGITNYIVREICAEYIRTFIDKFKNDIDKEIYNEIHRKEVLVDSEGDDIPSFQEILSYPLREIASDYIRNNSDEIVKSMIGEINTAITKFTDNKLMDAVLSDLRNLYTKRIKDMLEATKEE